MSFNSIGYAVLLATTLLLYYRLKHKQQNVLLLVASYFFYGSWDYRFLILMFASTVIDYVAGLAVEKAQSKGHCTLARAALVTSLAANLGLLGVFKYFGFFVWGATRLLASVGFSVSQPTLDIILPVGISFYTFQTMSYTIDVYRGRLKPSRNFVDFSLFVSFFPQLVAGPIERATELLPQVQRKRHVTQDMFTRGIYLILLGLLRKVVLADGAGIIADLSFGDPASRSSLQVMLALPLYGLQIYNDFNGYSDIARGSAFLLGFTLMRNFRHPYFAVNIQEFWRRWHISLSTWIRDYVYFPLGGSRCAMPRVLINIMITMLLCGLWHGAHWTFIFWGFLHGLFMITHRVWRMWRDRHGPPVANDTENKLGRVFAVALTYITVVSAWLVFRVKSFAEMREFVLRILDFDMQHATDLLPFGLLVGLSLLIDVPQALRDDEFCFMRLHRWTLAALTAACILTIWFFGGEHNAPFIYFQF